MEETIPSEFKTVGEQRPSKKSECGDRWNASHSLPSILVAKGI